MRAYAAGVDFEKTTEVFLYPFWPLLLSGHGNRPSSLLAGSSHAGAGWARVRCYFFALADRLCNAIQFRPSAHGLVPHALSPRPSRPKQKLLHYFSLLFRGIDGRLLSSSYYALWSSPLLLLALQAPPRFIATYSLI